MSKRRRSDNSSISSTSSVGSISEWDKSLDKIVEDIEKTTESKCENSGEKTSKSKKKNKNKKIKTSEEKKTSTKYRYGVTKQFR